MASARGAKWFWFPPFFSIIALIIISLLSNKSAVETLPPLIWGMFLSIYVCLSALSAFYIITRTTQHCGGIFLIAQGILLVIMGYRLGNYIFGWLGFFMLLVGLFIRFYQSTQEISSLFLNNDTSPTSFSADNKPEILLGLIDVLPFPICVTDPQGIITAANLSFSEAVGSEHSALESRLIEEILPQDRDETDFPSGHWWIRRIQEESRILTILSPTQSFFPSHTEGTPSIPQPQHPQWIDPETGLYTTEYQNIRVPEEIERTRRYRRWLSAGLISLKFSPPKEMPLSEQNMKMLFTAFATRVKDTLRSVDIGFLLDDQRILVLLPETPLSGAKTFLGRIQTLPQEAFDEDIREHIRPQVQAGLFFYNGNPPIEYEGFLSALESSLVSGENGS